MKYFLITIFILFSGCSLLMSDPEIAIKAEELIVEVTEDILKR